MKGRATSDGAKCAACGGWGYDRTAELMASCAACGGTGRPPAPPPAPDLIEQEREPVHG